MKDEALKLALEALEKTGNIAGFAHEREQEAITAIKQALTAPVQPCNPAEDGVCEALECCGQPAPVKKPVAWNETDELQCPICKITVVPKRKKIVKKTSQLVEKKEPQDKKLVAALEEIQTQRMIIDNQLKQKEELHAIIGYLEDRVDNLSALAADTQARGKTK
jgi:hypothetical protein